MSDSANFNSGVNTVPMRVDMPVFTGADNNSAAAVSLSVQDLESSRDRIMRGLQGTTDAERYRYMIASPGLTGHTQPVRMGDEEVTDNLLKIFDWCFRCHIEINIRRDRRYIRALLKNNGQEVNINTANMSDFYEYMRCNYREIFSTLRCHPLILE